MASGRPDYFRGVDVTYQSLPHITTRPKYGGGLELSGQFDCNANMANFFGLIIGKGMIYGGTVWLEYTSTQANSEIIIVLDGAGIWALSFYRLLKYGITKPRNSFLTLNVFDSVNYIYSVGFSYGVTFEKDFYLYYSEKHGGTPRIHYRLAYALI